MTATAMRLRHLVLVRHGETEGQSSIRYYGATDVPLSESGRRQLARVGRALADMAVDVIYTSALQRTVEGARIIAPDVPARAIASFNEVHFGEWEGLTREEIAARDPEEFRRWQASDDSFRYPEGESRLAFAARVTTGLYDVLRLQPPGHLLMVLHRGVIAIILADLLRLDRAQRLVLGIDLASIHVVSAPNGHWEAECLNRTDHLAQPAPATKIG